MHPVETFLRAIDSAWIGDGTRIQLRLIGSGALVLQTAYNRGTKDGDILHTVEVEAISTRLLELGGRGSPLHQRHQIYLEIVGANVPFLPAEPSWVAHDIELKNFDLVLLDVTDVVLTKLKRFHSDDKADCRAMVEAGHVDHARLRQRVEDVVKRLWFDARSDQLQRFVANFNTVERDYFGVPESEIEVPDEP